MARQRGDKTRRGGFRPPELRGTLGTLLRTTLQQAGAVRDALERSAREGRSRLDEALSSRKRHDALASLGEIVLDLIRSGEIDLSELPEAADLVRYLDELDDDRPPSSSPSADPDPDLALSRARRRFDDRPASPPRRASSSDDGTVSSTSRWSPSPPSPASPASPASGRVWRPPAEAPQRDDIPTEPPPYRRTAGPRDPTRKGGIRFDPDSSSDPDADLADYMHPDDIPPKPPSDGT